jgi:nucleoside-diphosphate-sugar epimerase
MATVAVTGGNGGFGREVVADLRSEHRVVNVSRSDTDDAAADDYVAADLTDPDAAARAVAAVDPDAVVHMAALSTPRDGAGTEVFASNAVAPYHVLAASADAGVDRVVLASSLSAVGGSFEDGPNDPDYLPLDETHPARPAEPYGLGKRVAEVVGEGFARRADAPGVVALRFPWVTDEAAMRETFLDADRTLAGLRDAGHYWKARQTYFAYLALGDALRAVRAALDADATGETLFLSAPDTNSETTTPELAAECYPDAELRGLSGYDALVDTTRARDVLDWRPRVSWRDLA